MQVSKILVFLLALFVPACTSVQPLAQEIDSRTPAIARWTSMPFVDHARDFRCEVSAYHASGIKGVEFTLDGRTYWVTDMTPDESGYYEYALLVKVWRLDPGQHEITAVVYPNNGAPLHLNSRNYDYENVKNGYNSFRFSVHNNTRVRVGPTGDYATVSEAVEAEGYALTCGGTIVLTPGDHVLDMPRLDNDGYSMTIDGRNAASISNPKGLKRGARNSSFRYINLTFNLDKTGTRFLSGCRDSRLIIENCDVIGEDEIDGYRKQWQTLGKAYEGDFNYGIFLKDVRFRHVWKGMNGVTTAKRVLFERITGDAFGSSPGAVIDCTVINAVKDETFHGQHCDLVQYSDGLTVQNRIVADLFAPRHMCQIGHMSGLGFAKDIAFVNWIIDCRESTTHCGFNIVDTDNMLIENMSLFRGQIVWRDTYHTRCVIRNTTMQNQTGVASDLFPFDDASDVNIRFTRRMSRDWGPGCTLGPILIHEDYSWSTIETIDD